MKLYFMLFVLLFSCGGGNLATDKSLVLDSKSILKSNKAPFDVFTAGGMGGMGYEDMTVNPFKNVLPYGNGDAFIVSTNGMLVGRGASMRGGDVNISDDYQYVVGNSRAFAALSYDGRIKTWGHSGRGGKGGPTESGFKVVVAADIAFAAISEDNSLRCWGYAGLYSEDMGQSPVCVAMPRDAGYKALFSSPGSFTALHVDTTVHSWGQFEADYKNQPTDTGFVAVASTAHSFAGLKEDGTLSVWGTIKLDSEYDLKEYTYKEVLGNKYAYAALTSDDRIVTFGEGDAGGVSKSVLDGDDELANRYVKISATHYAFAAINKNQEIRAWGHNTSGGVDAPSGKFNSVVGSWHAFAAIRDDGQIVTWGDPEYGAMEVPALEDGVSVVKLVANGQAFMAIDNFNNFYSFGHDFSGGGEFSKIEVR